MCMLTLKVVCMNGPVIDVTLVIEFGFGVIIGDVGL